MPFERRTVMEQKTEFVKLALTGEISLSQLCKRYNVSRPTGYKWLSRFEENGLEGLEELSRKPLHSPHRTSEEIEEKVISFRKENPSWGAKKIYHLLKRELGVKPPAKSTIHSILQRNGMIDQRSVKNNKWVRFEHPHPNALWQMDFKGYFPMLNQAICHPLTITDDHSRFNLALKACKKQTRITVESCLTEVFRQYGMPEMILCDNGTPWGRVSETNDERKVITKLEKWLIRLNIKPIHGRAYHPQTQGKEERFHRTLKTELLNYSQIKDHQHCQQLFDRWRFKYNHQRPHESLNFQVPMERYEPSKRNYPETLLPIEYNSSDQVRKVCDKGFISFKGKNYKVGKALVKEIVAIRPTTTDGMFNVYFCNHSIRTINLKV